MMAMANNKNNNTVLTPPLQALTAAAIILPGLLQTPAHATDEDSVDFQYSHYQEGKRDIYGMVYDYGSKSLGDQKLPQNLNPIEVDSIHGSGRFTLTDRIKFAFNYTQDTWSGATPIGTAPVITGVNTPLGTFDSSTQIFSVTGASPIIGSSAGLSPFFTNKNHSNFYQYNYDPAKGAYVPGALNNRLTMSFHLPLQKRANKAILK